MNKESRTHVPMEQDPERPKPLRVEIGLFLAGPVFFLPVAIIYGFLADWEPVGVVSLLLLTGLYGLVCVYLWLVSRRIDPRPEDDPYGEVAEHAGEYGVFSPHSWWPFVLGVAAMLIFFGVAAAWWITGVGFVLGAIGLVGQTYEFSRGIHRH